MERPYNQMIDAFREVIERSRDVDKFIFEKSDAIAFWLIGLSAGGIPIIVSNFNGIKQIIGNPYSIKIILILLLAAVVFGIFYRVAYLFYFAKLSMIMEMMNVAFTRRQTMDTQSYLTGNETYEELVFTMKLGFGKDYEDLISIYNQAEDIKKKMMYDWLVDYYQKSVTWAARDVELAIDFTDSQFKKYLGISTLKNDDNKTINLYKRSKKLTVIFYWIFMLSFISALIVFVFSANIH